MAQETQKITVKKFSGETSTHEISPPEAQPITGAELIAPIVPEMPEPTKAAVESAEQSPQNVPVAPVSSDPVLPVSPVTPIPAQPLNVPDVKDSEGTQFDPSLHRADSLGNPRFGASGKFLKKYKGGQSNAPANTPATPQTMTGQAGAPDQFDNGAEMLLQTGYGIGSSFFTNDIRPDSQEEHLSLKIPLAAVLREKGSVGMSPTQLLILSLAAYVSKKAAKPTVRDRFVLLYLKARAFFKGEPQPQEPKKIEPVS